MKIKIFSHTFQGRPSLEKIEAEVNDWATGKTIVSVDTIQTTFKHYPCHSRKDWYELHNTLTVTLVYME